MAKQYGIVKVDFITYTSGGDGFEVDQTIDVSGLSNISDSGITVTGTISGVSGIFSENLFVNGSGTFNDLIVNNDATIGGDLTVSGNINASGVTISGITGLFASGTEAAPSISFVDNTDTGFYNAAANEVRITTDGNDRLTVDSTGNVGIGTTDPSSNLQVSSIGSSNGGTNLTLEATGDNTSGRAGRIVFKFSDGDGGAINVNRSSGLTAADAFLTFRTGGSTNTEERMRILGNGNVGIGTTNPGGLLHVQGPDNNTQFFLTGTTGTTSRGFNISLSQEGTFQNAVATLSAPQGNEGTLAFQTGASERMRIASNGNVGIGETNPATLLHLKANSTNTTNFITLYGNRNAGDTEVGILFKDRNAVADGTDVGRIYTQRVTTANSFNLVLSSSNNGTLNDAVLIDPDGKVGIGTTTPDTELEVVAISPEIRATATGNSSANVGLNNTRDADLIGGQIFGRWNGNAVSAIRFINGADSVNQDEGQISFNTSNNNSTLTERLRITQDGKVGIGTQDPQELLELSTGSGPRIRLTDDNTPAASSNGYLEFYGSDARSAIIYTNVDGLNIQTDGDSPGPIIFTTANSGEKMRILGNGNVGIGATNPQSELQVSAGSGTRIEIETTADNTNGRSGNLVYSFSDGDGAAIAANRSSGLTAADVFLTFRTGGSTSSEERMRILANGNVGINSTNPGSRLQVEGDTTTAVIHIKNAFTAASAFDGGGTGLLLTSTGMNATSRFTPAIRFGSTDPDFVTQNPKTLAAINGIARSGYSSDTAGSMDLAFYTTSDGSATNNCEERMRIGFGGNVGIGTEAPAGRLHVNSSDTTRVFFSDDTSRNEIRTNNGNLSFFTNQEAAVGGNNNTIFYRNGTNESMRIDSDGRLLVGTTNGRSVGSLTPYLQLEGNLGSLASLSITRNIDSGNPAFLVLGKSRGTTNGSATIVQNGDSLATLRFAGADGVDLNSSAAEISALVDGTPGVNDMPGRLAFRTTRSGSSSPTERMRIDNNGTILTGSVADILNCSTSLAAGNTNFFFRGRHSGTAGIVGTGTTSVIIYTNGNIQNTNNSYTGISDAKLKENIVDASSQWDDLKALRVRNYNFKEGQTHTQIGLVAQEVELVSPGLVSESPDRDENDNDLGTVTKSVNYSVLYMKAVKALQEAMERIEQLESRLAALENN